MHKDRDPQQTIKETTSAHRMGKGNHNKLELQCHQHQSLLETKEATPYPRQLKEEAQGFASTVAYLAIMPKIAEPQEPQPW